MRQSDPKRPPKQVEPGGERRNPTPCHSNEPFSRCASVQIELLFNELLVAVHVVRIRHMRMYVPHLLVTVSMAMRRLWHRVMHMLVVSVVMAMCVFVLHRFVLVLVSV